MRTLLIACLILASPFGHAQPARINITYDGSTYGASLDDCYDGDTCTVVFDNALPFNAKQKLRFEGFDTPEIVTTHPSENKPRLSVSGFVANFS